MKTFTQFLSNVLGTRERLLLTAIELHESEFVGDRSKLTIESDVCFHTFNFHYSVADDNTTTFFDIFLPTDNKTDKERLLEKCHYFYNEDKERYIVLFLTEQKQAESIDFSGLKVGDKVSLETLNQLLVDDSNNQLKSIDELIFAIRESTGRKSMGGHMTVHVYLLKQHCLKSSEMSIGMLFN